MIYIFGFPYTFFYCFSYTYLIAITRATQPEYGLSYIYIFVNVLDLFLNRMSKHVHSNRMSKYVDLLDERSVSKTPLTRCCRAPPARCCECRVLGIQKMVRMFTQKNMFVGRNQSNQRKLTPPMGECTQWVKL